MEKVVLFVFTIINVLSFSRLDSLSLFYPIKFIFLFLLLCVLFVKKGIKLITLDLIYIIGLLFLWLVIATITLFRSYNQFEGILTLCSYLIFVILIFVLFPNYLNSQNIIGVLKAIHWGIIISIIIAIVLAIGDVNSFTYDERHRYMAIFKHPNFMGMFCFTGILTSISIYLYAFSKRYLLFLPPLLYLIYLTDSRTPLYLFILLIILFLSINFFYKFKTKYQFINIFKYFLSMIIFTVIVILILFMMDSYREIIEFLNILLSYRIQIWSNFLRELAESDYLLGIGLASNKAYDNSYLLMLMETGIVGFLVFIGFLLLVFIKLISLLRAHKGNRIHIAFVFSLYMVFLAYGFTESLLFTAGNIMTFFVWLLIGFYLNYIPIERKIVDCNQKIL